MIRAMHRLFVILAAALLAIPVAGSAPTRTHVPSAPVPLLWKATRGESSVYLLGSFHLLAKSDYPLSRDIDAAFDDAESLVFEVSPDDIEDPGIATRMIALASDSPSTFARVVPADVRERLAPRIRGFGLSPSQIDGFEPWFVDTTLVTLLAQRAGYVPQDGLDRFLMTRAKTAGKPTRGLETVEQQLRTLDAMPLGEQVAALREFADEADPAAKLRELHGAWRAGDIPKLEQLTREDMRDLTPVTYRRLNVDRNRAWMPVLDAMLRDGAGRDTLVVVGALHLLGDDGVVALLRAKGYRVERVCSACKATPARR